MSSGEELKPSPASAAAPVDNITTAAAVESTKRLRDDADCVGEIDEDDAAKKPPAKTSRTTGVGLPTDEKPDHIKVIFNGAVLAKFRDKVPVENALEVLRDRAECGTVKAWLVDNVDCVAYKHLSVDFSPYYFITEQAIPPPVEPEFAYENELKGQLLRYGSPTYDVKFIESYQSQASTFRPSTAREDEVGERPARFRAFLGPSGSGKTFSAIKRPFQCGLSRFDPKNHERYCTLYMAVSSVWNKGGRRRLEGCVHEAEAETADDRSCSN